MAYIQVELMAIEHAEFVAHALNCRKVEILGGLLELWQFSWKRREDTHQISALAAWFNFEPQATLQALAAFGFAEDLENGTFRVKGAERYLRIRNARAEAGRKGGQKRAENAVQNALSTTQASAKQVLSKSLAIASNDENKLKDDAENKENAKQVLSKSLASAKQVLSKSLTDGKQMLGITDHRTQNTEHRIITSNKGLFDESPDFSKSWNEKANAGLARVERLTDKRKAAIGRFLKALREEDWLRVIAEINASDFLAGRNGQKWKASFDWAINVNNAVKVLEGNYRNTASNEVAPPVLVASTKPTTAAEKIAARNNENKGTHETA